MFVDPTQPHPIPVHIPPGHMWIQGDNMSNSRDSRLYGPIPMGLIRGVVRAKLFPEWTWMYGPRRG